MSLTHEQEKSGLEGVVRVRRVAEHATTDPKDHVAMPPDERFQRAGIGIGGPAQDERRVGRRIANLNWAARNQIHHAAGSPSWAWPLTDYSAATGLCAYRKIRAICGAKNEHNQCQLARNTARKALGGATRDHLYRELLFVLRVVHEPAEQH